MRFSVLATLALLIASCSDSAEDCPMNHACPGDDGATCTYDSGPCTITLECRAAEGDPAWQPNEATCDVPPVDCDLVDPALEEHTNGEQLSALEAPIDDGDRCAFVGNACRYSEDGCRKRRVCQDDNTWSPATAECE